MAAAAIAMMVVEGRDGPKVIAIIVAIVKITGPLLHICYLFAVRIE